MHLVFWENLFKNLEQITENQGTYLFLSEVIVYGRVSKCSPQTPVSALFAVALWCWFSTKIVATKCTSSHSILHATRLQLKAKIRFLLRVFVRDDKHSFNNLFYETVSTIKALLLYTKGVWLSQKKSSSIELETKLTTFPME